MPTVLHNKSKPSPEKAAERGYQRGLEDAYKSLSLAVRDGLSSTQTQAKETEERYQNLWKNLPGAAGGHVPAELKRMLVTSAILKIGGGRKCSENL